MTTEEFIVSWTLDYGYRLLPEDGGDSEVIPTFAGEGTQAAFDQFFTQEALAKTVGRRVYCRCTGQRTVEDGSAGFTIQKAQLSIR